MQNFNSFNELAGSNVPAHSDMSVFNAVDNLAEYEKALREITTQASNLTASIRKEYDRLEAAYDAEEDEDKSAELWVDIGVADRLLDTFRDIRDDARAALNDVLIVTRRKTAFSIKN